MIDLEQIQREHKEWVERNFPSESPDRDVEHATLGVCEEAGELAHAILKRAQGVRGSNADLTSEALDALGDIFIYSLTVADYFGMSIETIYASTWNKVKQRDWVADPQSGGEL